MLQHIGTRLPPGRIQKGNFKTVSWSSFFLEFMDHVDRQATWAPVRDPDLVTDDTRLFYECRFSFPSKSKGNEQRRYDNIFARVFLEKSRLVTMT